MHKTFLLISFIISIFVFSCKKDTYITSSNASLGFSVDTVFFDTVFVSTGSITQSVKIINNNNQNLLLSNVKLMGGSNSVFKLNIDGNSTTQTTNITLQPNDSIYIFVSVLINPNDSNQAFILQDSIQVAFNGNQKYIQLQAYGQNAHFLNNQTIQSNTVWQNDKPYVILGNGIQVDTNVNLTIKEGCKIYFHANAPLIVNGTLNVQGTDSERVYFQSDRLDNPYNQLAGSWPGIFFMPSSKDNILSFAVINNGFQGLVTQGLSIDANPKLTLNDCIINNISNYGILSAQSNIVAQNCLFSNCGQNILLSYGGNYSFTNCTVAGYSTNFVIHSNPVLVITNQDTSGTYKADLNANFVNCIFWGDSSSVKNEVAVLQQTGTAFNVGFTNCLWREPNTPSNVTLANMIYADPQFDSLNYQRNYYDFHLQASSPAIGAGIFTGIPFDLDGNPRSVGGSTDIGCYQKQ